MNMKPEKEEFAISQESALTTVLIHWKIRPDPKSRDEFLHEWRHRFQIEERGNLVGEFLSKPLTEGGVGFDCKTFEHSDEYTSFFNVAIWKDAASFKSDVYDLLAKDRQLESYEFDFPERMVLTALNWRIGGLQLPGNDYLE